MIERSCHENQIGGREGRGVASSDEQDVIRVTLIRTLSRGAGERALLIKRLMSRGRRRNHESGEALIPPLVVPGSLCSLGKEISEQHVAGDVWLWSAVEADTKLVPCWYVGQRDANAATEFIKDLESRLASRLQLSRLASDGLKIYVNAVIDPFAEEVDYAQFVKYYGSDPEGQRRYSSAVCTGAEKVIRIGDPDPKHISTSYVERHNLSVRMTVRRFTRLTSAFSKKIENHSAAIALGYFAYNFIKINRTLRMTPAMAAGVTSSLWDVSHLV